MILNFRHCVGLLETLGKYCWLMMLSGDTGDTGTMLELDHG